MTHNALANDNHSTLREIAKKLILTKITKKKKEIVALCLSLKTVKSLTFLQLENLLKK